MTVIFNDGNRTESYDRNYIKDIYAQKQNNNTNVVSIVTDTSQFEADTVVFSRPVARHENYYNALAKDYLEGFITEEEFFNHMEDLFYGYGALQADAPKEKQQTYFNTIVHNSYNGILNYYLEKNCNEWATNENEAEFYYNTDYHYEHLDQVPSFLAGARKLAEKIGLDHDEERFNKNILTVNGRMATVFSCRGGSIESLDEAPPPGMKMIFYNKYYPYEARIQCDGKEYKTSIPFSYDDDIFKFELADLFADFDIPEKYQKFINNFTIYNSTIARSYSARKGIAFPYHFSEEIFTKIKDFDVISTKAANAYNVNSTSELFMAKLYNEI